jgi:hypothetical protein
METELLTIALMLIVLLTVGASAIIIHNHIDDMEARLTALIKDADLQRRLQIIRELPDDKDLHTGDVFGGMLAVMGTTDQGKELLRQAETIFKLGQENKALKAENALLRTVARAVESRQSILAEYGCWGILEALANLAAKGVKIE